KNDHCAVFCRRDMSRSAMLKLDDVHYILDIVNDMCRLVWLQFFPGIGTRRHADDITATCIFTFVDIHSSIPYFGHLSCIGGPCYGHQLADHIRMSPALLHCIPCHYKVDKLPFIPAQPLKDNVCNVSGKPGVQGDFDTTVAQCLRCPFNMG